MVIIHYIILSINIAFEFSVLLGLLCLNNINNLISNCLILYPPRKYTIPVIVYPREEEEGIGVNNNTLNDFNVYPISILLNNNNSYHYSTIEFLNDRRGKKGV